MRLIEPRVERLVQKPGIEGMYEMIDIVAGVSHNRHTPHDDPKKFVDSLIERGELSPLESGTVYLKSNNLNVHELDMLFKPPYSYVCHDQNTKITYITTNFRVITELGGESFYKFWCEPTRYHLQRPCFRFTLSRAIADDFVRHRSLSPMMRTSRRKRTDFDVVCPQWVRDMNFNEEQLNYLLEGGFDITYEDMTLYDWWYTLSEEQNNYERLVEYGVKPQDARGILGSDFATEITLCGFKDVKGQGWDNFIQQRCHPAAHVDAQYLANQVKTMLYAK